MIGGQGGVEELAGRVDHQTHIMGFPIDVVYVDKQHRVIRTTTNMVPYRLGPFVTQAEYVLEMPVGTIEQSRTEIGDQLEFSF